MKNLLLIIVFLSTSLTFSQTEINGINYNLNTTDNTASVTEKTECYSGDITIPETVYDGTTTYTVTSIGLQAFSGCTSLTSIILPNTITSIENQAFRQCISLTSITLPNTLTSIGFQAFFSCTTLPSITLPNSLTNIGVKAFLNCNSLLSITIPNSVTSIDQEAFRNCTSLMFVTALNPTPVIINANVFQNVPITTIPLYVADEAAVTAYQATAVWQDFNSVTVTALSIEDSEFANKITVYPNPTTGVLLVNSPNADVHQIEVFDVQGRIISLKQYDSSEQYRVDLSSLKSAMYFVKLYTSEGTLIKRVIRK